MQTYFDCLPCFVRQTLDAARMAGLDSRQTDRVLRETLTLLAKISYSKSPAYMAGKIHRRIREITAITDPYSELKKEYNRKALEKLPELRARVANSATPFLTAVRLAIAGNLIDFGLRRAEEEVHLDETIRDALAQPLAIDHTALLRKTLDQARTLLYIGDNAGEIVFDRVLIETFPATVRTTFAVRGIPIINDVTFEDARAAGIPEVAEVISSGSEAPGTVLEDASPEFRRRFDQAEVVIAKGQGNYETLSGSGKPNLFFILKAKCPVIAAHIGCPLGGMIVQREPADSIPGKGNH